MSLTSTPTDELRYTLDDCGILSEADRRFFEENGFFVVKGLIPEKNIKQYTERFQQICDNKVS